MKGLINIAGEVAHGLGSKMIFKMKKASPELLLVGGVACIVGATIMACKATKEAEEILDEGREKLDGVREASERDGDALPNALVAAETRKIRARTAGNLIRVYGPSVALGAAGLAMIFTSHGIMKKRAGALLAAYNALDAAFRQYRQRVMAEDGGKERDRKYLFGDTIDNSLINDINEEAMIIAHDRAPFGPYTFEFSPITTRRCTCNSTNNLFVIRGAEEWATRQLELEGHLFLNDVLRYLGIDEVPWGQIFGWIRGRGEDPYVTCLAIEDADELSVASNSWSRPVWLEFNCDGEIWDQL